MQKRGFLTSHILPFRSVKRLEEAGNRNTSLKGSKNRQEKWSLAERTRAQFLETAWKQAKKITIARKVSARETHVRVSRRKIQQTIKNTVQTSHSFRSMLLRAPSLSNSSFTSLLNQSWLNTYLPLQGHFTKKLGSTTKGHWMGRSCPGNNGQHPGLQLSESVCEGTMKKMKN